MGLTIKDGFKFGIGQLLASSVIYGPMLLLWVAFLL